MGGNDLLTLLGGTRTDGEPRDMDRHRLKSVKLKAWEYPSLLVRVAAARPHTRVGYASDGIRCQFMFVCVGPVLEESEFLTGQLELAVESLLRSSPGLRGLELRSGELIFECDSSGKKQRLGSMAEGGNISSVITPVMTSWPEGFILTWNCSMLGYIYSCFKHPKLFRQAFLEAGIAGIIDDERVPGATDDAGPMSGEPAP